MSLEYEPSSEPLHISAKWLFLNLELTSLLYAWDLASPPADSERALGRGRIGALRFRAKRGQLKHVLGTFT